MQSRSKLEFINQSLNDYNSSKNHDQLFLKDFILRFIQIDLKWGLTLLFAFLGPLGNILAPHFLPASFRAYYFLLPFFFIFYLQPKEKSVRVTSFFLPFFIYSLVSCFIVDKLGSVNEEHTLFRFFLLLFQFLFVIGAAFSLKDTQKLFSLLKIYLRAYLVSQCIGFVFFLGYYSHLVPLSLIERFSVLTQFGFRILRFSPGSYPNEYGIVSSFALCLLFLSFMQEKIKKMALSPFFFMFFSFSTFLALFLTTTRAAFLSFFISMIYLFFTSLRQTDNRKAVKLFAFLCLFFIIASFFVSKLNISVFKVIQSGFTQKISEGSLGDRYFIWLKSIQKVKENLLVGTGFASLTNIHNVYLQLLFEMGLIGSFLLLIAFALSFLSPSWLLKKREENEDFYFFKQVRILGLIHVLSFAASNHNLNHHLSWFICLFCLASLHLRRLSLSQA